MNKYLIIRRIVPSGLSIVREVLFSEGFTAASLEIKIERKCRLLTMQVVDTASVLETTF